MGERERNAVFNSLSGVIFGADVLDMFAGSGAVGLEALSRGANSVTFIENDRAAREAIRLNLQSAGASAEVSPVIPRQKYDIIIADPPYDNPQYDLVAELPQYLKHKGTLVLSHPTEDDPPELPGLALTDTRTYAGARISTYASI